MITIAYNERYGTLERLYFAGLDADKRLCVKIYYSSFKL